MHDQEHITKLNTLIQAGQLKRSHAGAVELVLSIEDETERLLTFLRLTEALLREGGIDEAEQVVRSLERSLQEYAYERASAWRDIAAAHIHRGQRDQALKTLLEAEAIAQTVDGAWQQAETLHRTANLFAAIEQINQAHILWDQAIAIARAGENSQLLQDSLDCGSVLREIATDLADRGYVAKAKEVAMSIKDDARRSKTLRTIQDIENPAEEK
ncbi:MAG: hypothetical protein JOZ51_07045 [Chloroflexi bacterium]|nr:hypothetical protein [Chloroflexota bacterium]